MDDKRKEDETIKESRRILRQIESHIVQAQQNLGAVMEELGLVQVLHHPTSPLAYLNYVAPRRNTAWIPVPQIEKGLNHLRELGRQPRFHLIEGLFPPLFAKSLREMGLIVEREVALMAYTPSDKPRLRFVSKPEGLQASVVQDQEGIALWWYVYRNARYDVVANGIEPVYVGRDMRELVLGNQKDIILNREGFPVGVARLTLTYASDSNGDPTGKPVSADITAAAVLKEARNAETLSVLYQTALDTALQAGCSLVFTNGETEADRYIWRKLGFVDAGSVICYAESDDQQRDSQHDHHMEQPAFIMQ